MSKIGDLITGTLVGASLATGEALVHALFVSNRSIGGIIPDVTFEEHHTDELTITDHPVEQGAAITDHAFKNPSEVTMKVGWSDARALINSIVSGSLFSGRISSANDLYEQMLSLQESREIFDLVTGKRTYNNMLIKRIDVVTNNETENVLVMDVFMRQIIIVNTNTVALAATDNQSTPQDTGAVQNAGTKQPVVSPKQSALSILFGGE